MEIILQVGVKALLKNKQGKYLLVKRSHKKYSEVKGRWDIVGGRIVPGISLMENLAREVKEETGLVMIGEPKLIAAQDILRISGRHVVRLSYVADADGEVVLDKEELEEYKWLSEAELNKLDDVDIYFKEILKEWLRTN